MTPGPPPEDPSLEKKTRDPSRAPVALSGGTRLREEYRIEDVLGAGGFGITYKARDEHLGDPVAIKEYYPRHLAGRTEERSTIEPYSSQEESDFAYGLDQFMQEGRRLARFEHTNIADVRSYFEENGTGYLVMDYYEGQTVADHLVQSGGRLPEEKALGLMQDVLSGLQVIHDEGLLHRDIDPQNVYRTTSGTGILLDFGAARAAAGQKSQSLSVILKPGYAPIEQYSADGNQGPHTDIYACAATLYKCLTGLKPPEATERVQEDELVPPREMRQEISMETSVAVRKGLAVYPDRRPASAEAFASLLGGTRTAKNPNRTASKLPPTAQPTAKDETEGTPSDIGHDTSAPSQLTEEAGSTADSPFGESAKFGLGLVGGLVGLVGGTLLLSDTGAVEVLAFFGTWLAVSVGIAVLFREGEKAMNPASRAAVSDWLLREQFAERPSNWPGTFVSLFDAVFTEKHLSWRCFRRSALASIITSSTFFLGLIALGFPIGNFPGGMLAGAVRFIAIGCAFNVVIDYISLYETRWVLGRMAETEKSSSHVGYLLLDLALTQAIFALGLGSTVAPAMVIEGANISEVAAGLIGGFAVFYLPLQSAPASPIAYTTLFTSVWVWLYVGSGLLLRSIRPILESLDWLKRHLDVEARPVHAMGLLLAFLTTIGFAIGAPFAL